MSDQIKQVTGTPIDLDGDRETDAMLNGPFDVTGDGVADAVTADVDFDGNADGAIIDLDQDGEVETAAAFSDLDGDGREESVEVDVGMDGSTEAVVADVAGDGTADVIVADTDVDGELDTAVVDSDNDGVFDTIVEADGVTTPLDDTVETCDDVFTSQTDVGYIGGTGHVHDEPTYGPDGIDDLGYLDSVEPDDSIGVFDSTDELSVLGSTEVDDTTDDYTFDGGVADYSGVDGYGTTDDYTVDSGTTSYSMIQDYSDDTSLEDPVTATDAWENGLGETYQTYTDASNEAYQESTAAWLAGDTENAYDLNQQSLEYGATADEAWDTYSTWDSSSVDAGTY